LIRSELQYKKRMKKILIATHNKAKLGEIMLGVTLLINKGWKIYSLNDLHILKDPEETGKTFEENAELKAKYYSQISKMPTIADDGGLMIDHLQGEPGVKSKRWMGYETTDENLIQYTLQQLINVKKNNRTAYLQTCLCYFDPLSGKIIKESERIKGYIAEKQSRKPTYGYPFRALFVVDTFNKYYDELTDKEHQKINHRIKALTRLINKI